MGWFKNKSEKDTSTVKSPLELVTDLMVTVQLADNRADYSEKEAWRLSLIKLFPDHQKDNAEQAMQNSFQNISELDSRQRLLHVEKTIKSLVDFYSIEKVKNDIIPELYTLVEADGIVMSSESDLMDKIKAILAQADSYM